MLALCLRCRDQLARREVESRLRRDHRASARDEQAHRRQRSEAAIPHMTHVRPLIQNEHEQLSS